MNWPQLRVVFIPYFLHSLLAGLNARSRGRLALPERLFRHPRWGILPSVWFDCTSVPLCVRVRRACESAEGVLATGVRTVRRVEKRKREKNLEGVELVKRTVDDGGDAVEWAGAFSW